MDDYERQAATEARVALQAHIDQVCEMSGELARSVTTYWRALGDAGIEGDLLAGLTVRFQDAILMRLMFPDPMEDDDDG